MFHFPVPPQSKELWILHSLILWIAAISFVGETSVLAGTNPLSGTDELPSLGLNFSKSEKENNASTIALLPTTVGENSMLNISEKVNNSDISHSNASTTPSKNTTTASSAAKKPKSRFAVVGRRRNATMGRGQGQGQPRKKKKERSLYYGFSNSLEGIRGGGQGGGQAVNADGVRSLRRKILSKLGEVDPLLCLPKALCGMSSKKSQSHHPPLLNSDHFHHHKTSLSSGLSNEIQTNSFRDTTVANMNDYLAIMKSVVPKSESAGSAPFPTAKPKPKPKRRKNAKKPKDEDEENDDDASDSNEQSDENNHSAQEDHLLEDEYLKDKVNVEKWMGEEDFGPTPNWWDVLPPNKPYYNVDEKPGHSLVINKPGLNWAKFSPYRISKSLTSFFGSFLPTVTWGFGNSHKIFQSDPFFHDLRSLGGSEARSNSGQTDRDQRSFSSLFGLSDSLGGQPKSTSDNETISKAGGLNNNSTKGGGGQVTGRSARRDKYSYSSNRNGEVDMNLIDDPVEKFQLAIEIGKQLEKPKQCDYVFTGCPFTYQEIIDIVESSKKAVEEEEKLGILRFGGGQGSSYPPGIHSSYQAPKNNSLSFEDLLDMNFNGGNLGTRSPQLLDFTTPRRRRPISSRTPGYPMMSSPTVMSNSIEETTYAEPSSTRFQQELATMLGEELSPTTPYRSDIEDLGVGGTNEPLPSIHKLEYIDPSEATMSASTLSYSPVFPSKSRKKKPIQYKYGKSRQQWGWKERSPTTTEKTEKPRRKKKGSRRTPKPSSSPSPTVLREAIRPQQSYHSRYKYKPFGLPTTINKPSHIINYHFHNSHSSPPHQVSSNNGHAPQQLTVHSYAPPSLSTTEITTTTTKGTSRPQKRRQKGKGKSKARSKPTKVSSEERIIIRLSEKPNHNYYNVYPNNVPGSPGSGNSQNPQPPPPAASQPQHQPYYNQYQNQMMPSAPQQQSPYYYTPPQAGGYMQHQSSIYAPSPMVPPFSYWGKK